MNCFYISIYILYHKNSGNYSVFDMFLLFALANVIVYYILITINLGSFLVDGAILSVSFEMSSFMESLARSTSLSTLVIVFNHLP